MSAFPINLYEYDGYPLGTVEHLEREIENLEEKNAELQLLVQRLRVRLQSLAQDDDEEDFDFDTDDDEVD